MRMGAPISKPYTFHKVLAKYYIKWFQDCCESAVWCRERGRETQALQYIEDAKVYLTIIMENWDAIEFFSQGSNAHIVDRALPEQWRGYP